MKNILLTIIGLLLITTAFTQCDDDPVVCCAGAPVVPDPVISYELVPESECTVPENLVGYWKQIVDDSLCKSTE